MNLKPNDVEFNDTLSIHPGWLKLIQDSTGITFPPQKVRVNSAGRVYVQDLRQALVSLVPKKEIPTLMARLASHVHSLTFGSFSTALWTSPDLHTALMALEEFAIVLSVPIRLKYMLNPKGQGEIWILDLKSLDKESQVSMVGVTLLICTICRMLSLITGHNELKTDVRLMDQNLFSDTDKAELERLTNSTISYGATVRKIRVDKQFLYQPLPNRNREIHYSMTSLLRNESKNLKRNDLVLSILNVLEKQKSLFGLTGIDVANKLNMNIRTLNRRLAIQGACYKKVLEQFKLEKALFLIETSDHNMTEIAYQLGYSDLSTFSRAFKKWTGKSPKRTQYESLYH
ncbi:helix-turn-helix transcriptional regulator [Vibrio sp. FNV 38]|nr:helix-turn-helix transcriptional regulator [Vibrio sp. FNV 38]